MKTTEEDKRKTKESELMREYNEAYFRYLCCSEEDKKRNKEILDKARSIWFAFWIMKTYYYMAYAKLRGGKEISVGDGIRTEAYEGQPRDEIRTELARNYRTAKSRIKLVFRPGDQK